MGRKQGVLSDQKSLKTVRATRPAPSGVAELSEGVPTFAEIRPLLAEMSDDDLFRGRYRLIPFLERLVEVQLKDQFTVFPKNRIKECHIEAAKHGANEGRDPTAWAAGIRSGRSGKKSEPTPDMDALVFQEAQELGLREYRATGKWADDPARNLWRGLREQLSRYFDSQRIDALPVDQRPKFIIEIEGFKLRIRCRPDNSRLKSQQGVNPTRNHISMILPASLEGGSVPSSGVKIALNLKDRSSSPLSRRETWKQALYKDGESYFSGFAALLSFLEDGRVYDKFEAYDDIKADLDCLVEGGAPARRVFGPFYHYYLTPHLQPSRWLYSVLHFVNYSSDIAAETLAPFVDGSGLIDHLRAVRAGDSLLFIRGAVREPSTIPPDLYAQAKLWDRLYSRQHKTAMSEVTDERIKLTDKKQLTSTIAHYEWFPLAGRVYDTATAHGIVFSEPDPKLHPNAGFVFAPCLLSCTPLIPEAEQEGALSEADGAKLLGIWAQLMSATSFRFQ